MSMIRRRESWIGPKSSSGQDTDGEGTVLCAVNKSLFYGHEALPADTPDIISY